MLLADSVQALHVEFTSRCNLHCDHCARTNSETGNTIQTLPMMDLHPSVFKKAVDSLKNIKLVHACGNYGDIVAYKEDIFEIINICKEHSNIELLRLYTNGSAKSKDFWSKLGKESKDIAEVVFSIDGLEDTNKIYRRGSIWKKVYENAQAYIDSGGRAIWEMLVFAHNEHQVEEARMLSEKLGFAEFRVKKPNRFDLVKKKTVQASTIEKFNFLENSTSEITCKYKQMNWLYLSFEGELLTCCWIGGSKYKMNQSSNDFLQFYVTNHGNKLSVEHSTVDDILKSEFYIKLQASWVLDPLTTCKKKCGNRTQITKKYIQ